MGGEKSDFGRLGEKLARKFLRRKKFKILRSNVDRRLGEIDVIALDGDTVVFVEVKTAGPSELVKPHEQFTRDKMVRMTRASLAFVKEKRIQDRPMRMDFLGITIDADGKPQYNHVPNAFNPSDVMPGLFL